MKKLLPLFAVVLLAACVCKKKQEAKKAEAAQEQVVDLKDSKELSK